MSTEENTPVIPQSPLVYACLWQRAAAVLIDNILLTLLCVVALQFITDTTVLATVLSVNYYAYCHISGHQATFGERALKLKFTTLDGQAVSRKRAFGKELAYIAVLMVEGIIGGIVAAIILQSNHVDINSLNQEQLITMILPLMLFIMIIPELVMVSFSAKKQSITDKLLGTVLVQANPNISHQFIP